MKKFFVCMTGFLFGAQVFSQNAFVADSLDTYITLGMKQWQIPGMAIAIVKDGQVIKMQGYGVREFGRSDRVDENTLFLIGSCTKAFTATAMCVLEYEKKLSLEDKVIKWLPDFRLYDSLATQEVTLRDMICHRVGFQTFQGDFVNWNSNLTREELIHNVRNYKPVYGFRTHYGYFNMGFVTDGHILKLACDTAWNDFLQNRFFNPLQMSRTVTSKDMLSRDKNACVSHTVVNGKLIRIGYPDIDAMAPCGSIASCVKDMANWLIMQLDSGRFNGRAVVPFDVLQKTRTSSTIVSDYNGKLFQGVRHFSTYGLGWFLEDYGGKKVIQHSGGVDGFLTQTTFIPELNVGYIIVSNNDEQNLYSALDYQLRDAFLGLPYRNYSNIYFQPFQSAQKKEQDTLTAKQKTIAEKPKTEVSLQSYAGKYGNKVYGAIEIKLEKNKLNIYFQHHPHNIGQLEPLGGNRFWCTYSDPEFGMKEIPFTVDGGKVKSVTIRVNDFIDFMSYEFEKIQ
jgi:CubicO group peptidase (beta-lactamase class C family)